MAAAGVPLRWIVILITLLTVQMPLPARSAEVWVCIYPNPPLGLINEQGQALGLMPDLLRAVAEENQWQLNFIKGNWNQCLERLEQGSIALLPAIAYTEERAARYRFARETVMTNWGQLYQFQGEPYDAILDLEGRRVAVLANDVHFIGQNGLRWMADNFSVDIHFLEVDSYHDAFARLSRGEVDAALVNRLFGLENSLKYDVKPTSILLNPIQIRPAFAATSDPLLVQQFDQQLAVWKAERGSIYYQLLERWLQPGKEKPGTLSNLLLGSVLGLLLVLILVLSWGRRRVRLASQQLSEKNRLLEEEHDQLQRIEGELRERQQQYQVLFEDSLSIMLLIDPLTAEVVDANPAACRFYQYPREQFRGLNLGRLNLLSQAEIQKKLSRIESREQQQYHLQHRLASGESREVEVQSSPIEIGGRSLICSIVSDISARKQTERQLEERNRFLQLVIDSVSDPLLVIGTDHRVIKMNRAARENLSQEFSGPNDLSCHLCFHASQMPCNDEEHPCPLQKVQETGAPVTMIHHLTTPEGRRIIELSASPLHNPDGSLQGVIEVARDITKRQQAEEMLSENEKRLHHLAHHDPLTDLPNRLLFEDRMKQALSKARRSGCQVALFFLDLDHFKDVNDNLGHDFGDLLLIDIASRLRSSVRESDTVARMGGDEFLILLEEIESIEMVEIMAERICSALNHELTRDNYYQRVSASIGISLYPDDGISAADLLKNADMAMYRAKNQGKATYQFYSSPRTESLF